MSENQYVVGIYDNYEGNHKLFLVQAASDLKAMKEAWKEYRENDPSYSENPEEVNKEIEYINNFNSIEQLEEEIWNMEHSISKPLKINN